MESKMSLELGPLCPSLRNLGLRRRPVTEPRIPKTLGMQRSRGFALLKPAVVEVVRVQFRRLQEQLYPLQDRQQFRRRAGCGKSREVQPERPFLFQDYASKMSDLFHVAEDA